MKQICSPAVITRLLYLIEKSLQASFIFTLVTNTNNELQIESVHSPWYSTWTPTNWFSPVLVSYKQPVLLIFAELLVLSRQKYRKLACFIVHLANHLRLHGL